MSGVKKISRTELFSDSEPEIGNDEIILPKLEFEIVEIDNPQTGVDLDHNMNEEDQDEFDFPLFSFGDVSAVNKSIVTTETKSDLEGAREGRSLEKTTIRVSLRSPSPEVIIQDRPESYYFARYDDLQRKQFFESAITGDDVIGQSEVRGYFSIGKVINLEEYNDKIEKEISRIKKQNKIRPGKKKRLAMIESRKNNQERAKVQKQIENEKQKKLLKKIHHKRGGKKNKKKAQPSVTAKPKYRTE